MARDSAARSEHFAQRRAKPPPPLGYLNQLAAAGRWSGIPRARRISCPTLVLAGDDDRLVPLVNARVLTSLIPNAELVVIRGAGHLFLIDQTADVVPLISAFMRRV